MRVLAIISKSFSQLFVGDPESDYDEKSAQLLQGKNIADSQFNIKSCRQPI